jgi:hypothetical protein
MEGRDYVGMSDKAKYVVKDGKVRAAYSWDNYHGWQPDKPLPEGEPEHVFEKLIGIGIVGRLNTVNVVYDYLEKELDLMRERYERGVIPNAKIAVIYDVNHCPASIEFYAPVIWSIYPYYRMIISDFKAGVTEEDTAAWDAYGNS